MTSLELLAPAKNLACGIAAIDHGADAVYIGASRFGARSAAGNSLDDIRQLCDYAHPFGVKVYVTVNTILYDDELDATRQLLLDLQTIGVDAILVQDMAIWAICNHTVQSSKFKVQSGVDAIYAWHHNYGCSQLSGDHENTRKVLRDICLHPNAGAVLVLSLGCENNQPDDFMKMLGDYDKDRIKLLVTQKVEDEMEAGMTILRELYDIAKQDKREEVPVNKLRVGLKCGGSDGFSGITANPLVGEFSDWLVAQGGTSVLTEVPEMFGAETILMNRCRTEELFNQTVSMINNFKEYFLSHGEPVGENPSPG